MPACKPKDQVVIDRWWQTFVATGCLPAELERVQGRLIRAVHCGSLPTGPVHIKTMTFPRAKDRLRYSVRALPARHEARMLLATKAAGIPCPDVLAVRTERRWGLPHRSMLVLRTLTLATEPEQQDQRARDEVDMAVRLLAAGVHHRDLHSENFVRCASGELAVLDLQSASLSSAAVQQASSARLAVAARILRDRQEPSRTDVLAHMRAVSLLKDDGEVRVIIDRAQAEADRYQTSRLRRCLMNSTEFERFVRLDGIEYRQRGELSGGRWWRGARDLRRAWIGQRRRQLHSGVPLPFMAFFHKWWWLGGGGALYVPSTWSDERIETELLTASAETESPSSGRCSHDD